MHCKCKSGKCGAGPMMSSMNMKMKTKGTMPAGLKAYLMKKKAMKKM